MYEIELKNKLGEITGNKNIKLNLPPPGLSDKWDISTNAAFFAGSGSLEELASRLENELDFVQAVEVSGPGFVNISIREKALLDELQQIVSLPDTYGSAGHGGSIIFEMVSSNPTGPLHIGHGRGAAIGDSLARMYERIGYEVFREYYVNDAGRQMELLGESVFSHISGTDMPGKGYRGAYIKDIAGKLSGCSDARECTQEAGSMILDDHIGVLRKFRVDYDNIFSEKEMISSGKVEDIINELEKRGFTYKKDNALWFESTRFGDDLDRVLIKDNGDLTYFASDCAYHADKASRFVAALDIWGADHHGYVPRMNAFWKAAGIDDEGKKLEVLLYQLVNLKRSGEKVAMSTRSGEFITLEEVIDEVGIDATRFFMLMRSSDSQLEFDMDLAKEESKKNPVYYVQYSHARICSVFRKSGVKISELSADGLTLPGAGEKALIRVMARFPYILDRCVELNSPHLMTEYLRDVAGAFHKYYDTVRVLGSDEEKTRLLLLAAVRQIIKNGLELVGVNAPETM